ncbi:hypothetical protein GCM10009689_17090 [Brevibacterium antiquum]|uniref:PD-(D/E)XK nuclease family protein n=1 Tax=Brevibacterium antiquum TaxID=234835 RepID=UPI0018E00402|nr:PD-(D/E)XK nuclease family protein [Brevibacterium antiquum]
MAFVGDRLEIDKELVEDKVRRKAMSPSTMNALAGNGCQARFAIEKIVPRDESAMTASAIGTTAHSVLEDLYGLPGNERTMFKAAELAATHVGGIDLSSISLDGFDYDKAIEAERAAVRATIQGEVHTAYRGIFNIEDPEAVNVYSTEAKLSGIELSGVPVVGFIDRVDEVDGKLVVNDYKTGKQKKASSMFGDPHGDQLRIYALAGAKLLDREIENALVLYTKHSKAQRVAMSSPKLKKTERLFVDTWEELGECSDDATFETTPSGLCAYCPLARICPESKVAEGGAVGVPQVEPDAVAVYPKADEAPAETDESEAEESVSEPAAEADSVVGEDIHETGESTMTRWPEDKPWEPEVKGRLNPNSWAAGGIAGVVTNSIKHLNAAGYAVNKKHIRALSSTLTSLISRIESGLAGGDSADWGSGVNSLVRLTMWRLLDHEMPIPFGVSSADWQTWENRVVNASIGIIATTEAIYDDAIKPGGWVLFTSDNGESAEPATEAAAEADTDDSEEVDEEAEDAAKNEDRGADKTDEEDEAIDTDVPFDDIDDEAFDESAMFDD